MTHAGHKKDDKKDDTMTSGVLHVTVHGGKGLRKVDIFGKGDPYVIVKVNTQKLLTTAVKSGDSPEYEESVECILSDITKSQLSLEVHDRDLIKPDGKIGFAFVNLQKKPIIKKAPLLLSLPEKSDCGNLIVSVNFSPLLIVPPPPSTTNTAAATGGGGAKTDHTTSHHSAPAKPATKPTGTDKSPVKSKK